MQHPNWRLYEEFLDKATCERWIEAGRQTEPGKAKTFDGNDGHRKTQIRWLQNNDMYREMHDVFKHIAL